MVKRGEGGRAMDMAGLKSLEVSPSKDSIRLQME